MPEIKQLQTSLGALWQRLGSNEPVDDEARDAMLREVGAAFLASLELARRE